MTELTRAWLPRLNSRRYRQILIACVATLGISGFVLGTMVLVRWRAARAVRSDTRVVLTQAVQQLLRALQCRRGTLTLLRDTLDKIPSLTNDEQSALAKSAVAHTRHLLGLGVVRANGSLSWWVLPTLKAESERTLLNRAIVKRTRSSTTMWRAPSTFTVLLPSNRSALVMLEPLKTLANRGNATMGVFDLTPLLIDFFELTLQQPYPVQLLEHDRVFYRSSRWLIPSAGRLPTLSTQSLHLDSIQWTLQMQPGTTKVVQTMSWLNVLLATFGLLAGLAAIGMIWLLVMRTWILQRAVSRRTAALRRTTERLRQLATTDELTGLYNRRFFLERWQWECDRAKRYARPLGCLMIDVDKFKRINDVLGHLAGDLILKQVAQELKANLRQPDFLARFGGDEFIIALPETSVEQAQAVAEKLRSLSIQGPGTIARQVGPVRLSVGLSHIGSDESAQQVIQQADANLYASRQAVRNHAASAVEISAGPPAG